MCGGALEVNNETVATCSYCGTQQTLPKLDDEKRAQLYDRANYFRRENEFDKAMGIYEMILSDEKTDSEAYWGIVLCRYGIEYVEDPRTHKRIPTVNRAQFTSIFDDEDYKKALEYSDSLQKGIYEAEAGIIDKIQKGILAVSSKEDPFDIFICYKETDSFGNRTQDSVYAQDIYNALVKEGYKVFFSRITLEDKLGSAYEPYIFAALNSAKVMLVVGTSKDNFNAVWVKNEWSRFISLIKAGKEKTLIPLYKDISPYEMPEEFQYLQSQDMGKIGYLQDVIHGIKKLVEANVTTVKETVVVNAGNTQIEPLLKRAFMFLEDGDWKSADEYCEKVLDINPECAEAYLGKLLAELHVKKKEALKDCENPFDDKNNYQKVLCYGDPILKTELKGYTEHINVRKKSEYIASIYESAETAMMLASYEKAISLFESISDYKDSATLANEARKRLVAQKRRNKKIGIIAVACVVSLIVSLVLGINIDNNVKYNNAVELMEEGKYTEAIAIFEAINGYKDSSAKIGECNIAILESKYDSAIISMNAGKYEEAISAFEELAGYKDSVERMLECRYNAAIALKNSGDIFNAYEALIALGGYKDSEEIANSIYEDYMNEKFKHAQVGDYISFGLYEQDGDFGNGKEDIEWLVLDVQDGKALVICKYALASMPYNDENTSLTWETCTLRDWLNDDFIDIAFSDDEKSMIPTVTVCADKNPEYNFSNPGNDTQDKIFLLSIDEVEEYFDSDSARQCEPTDYAVANGAYESDGNCIWWLRTPGSTGSYAACVYSAGDVYVSGDRIHSDYRSVRPAMWIEIE
jgi:tetratricopeptide (TPR) repeat protein